MIDEVKEKSPLRKKLFNVGMAVVMMAACVAFVKYGNKQDSNYKESSIDHYDSLLVDLEFDRAISYKFVDTPDGPALDVKSVGPCKVLKTKLHYDGLTGELSMVYGADTIRYNFLDKGYLSGQMYFSNEKGQAVAMTRLQGDSVLVIAEKPYFIILSKGFEECITIDQLPLPAN